MNNKSLYEAFGFHNERPILIGFALFGEALTPTDSFVSLGMNSLTRKFEYQAGMFKLLCMTKVEKQKKKKKKS